MFGLFIKKKEVEYLEDFQGLNGGDARRDDAPAAGNGFYSEGVLRWTGSPPPAVDRLGFSVAAIRRWRVRSSGPAVKGGNICSARQGRRRWREAGYVCVSVFFFLVVGGGGGGVKQHQPAPRLCRSPPASLRAV